MKIAHISDIHLGAKLTFLGEKAEIQRENIKKAFVKSIDTAILNKSDVFIIAGDLFDSLNPSKSTVLFAINAIKRLVDERIYVALIAGNHDYICDQSVYMLPDWNILNSKYFKLYKGKEEWFIEDLDLSIFGSSILKSTSSADQLENIPDLKGKYSIGVFHGSVDILDVKNYPLKLDLIKKSPFNYIALGDWHSMLEVTKNAWYSGAIEILKKDQSSVGKILFITMDENALRVEPYVVGKIVIENVEIDISTMKSNSQILKYIEEHISNNVFLNLELKGIRDVDFDFSVNALEEVLKEKVFFISIVNSTELQLSEERLNSLSKYSIIKNYIEYFNEVSANDKLKKLALEKGLQLLSKGLPNED